MNETDWLVSSDPGAMLEQVVQSVGVSERKLRLFSVACCYRIWHLLPSQARKALELAERYAEGRSSFAELQDCEVYIERGFPKKQCRLFATYAVQFAVGTGQPQPKEVASYAANAVAHAAVEQASLQLVWRRKACGKRAKALERRREMRAREKFEEAQWDEQSAQADLLHDLFGPLPFRPIGIDSSWLAWSDQTVVRLARSIYDGRAFEQMSILGDSLEDAGCVNEEILRHCREQGGHTRGCWLVELLLGAV